MYIHTYISIHIYVYLNIYIHMYLYIYIYIYIYKNTFNIYIHTHIYTCVFITMYIYIYIHMYSYIHTCEVSTSFGHLETIFLSSYQLYRNIEMMMHHTQKNLDIPVLAVFCTDFPSELEILWHYEETTNFKSIDIGILEQGRHVRLKEIVYQNTGVGLP